MHSFQRGIKRFFAGVFGISPESLSIAKAWLFIPVRKMLRRPWITNRESMPVLIRYLGLRGSGVEIGVADGIFSELLLRYSCLSELVSVDPWKDFSSEEYEDINNVGLEEQSRRHDQVIRLLAGFGSRSRVVRDLSENAAGLFREGELDFVYIDANHSYGGCKQDLELWWPKLKEGGVFSGHDYLNGDLPQGKFGVKKAVDEFVSEKRQKLFVTRDDWPTWYLIKRAW